MCVATVAQVKQQRQFIVHFFQGPQLLPKCLALFFGQRAYCAAALRGILPESQQAADFMQTEPDALGRCTIGVFHQKAGRCRETRLASEEVDVGVVIEVVLILCLPQFLHARLLLRHETLASQDRHGLLMPSKGWCSIWWRRRQFYVTPSAVLFKRPLHMFTHEF